jgi:hypothetical protein
LHLVLVLFFFLLFFCFCFCFCFFVCYLYTCFSIDELQFVKWNQNLSIRI